MRVSIVRVRVPAPVRARHRLQLERSDGLRARGVRAAAQVGERAVGVQRYRLQGARRVRVLGRRDEVVDQLDLVVLPFAGEALARLRGRDVAALERLGLLDVRAHALFDLREVGLGDAHAVGKLEVVVEAVGDRRADRDLHALVQLEHRLGEHVRGVVADQLKRLLCVLLGEDRKRRAVGQRAREVAQLGRFAGLRVTDLDRQRRARQPRPDRRGGVGARRAVCQRQRRSVGECHRERHLSGAGYPPAPPARVRRSVRGVASVRAGVRPAARVRRRRAACAARGPRRRARRARARRHRDRRARCCAP